MQTADHSVSPIHRVPVVIVGEKLMTHEEFMALPDDGVTRELWEGVLKEFPQEKVDGVPVRNRFHSYASTKVSKTLDNWVDDGGQGGQVHSGDVGALLQNEPDTTVGIDVAYFSADTMARQTGASTIIVGAPVLAAEINSPGDSIEGVHQKVQTYLKHGTSIVWIINPYARTLQIFRRGQPPVTLNDTQTYENEELLPGLRFAVADLFVAVG